VFARFPRGSRVRRAHERRTRRCLTTGAG
jgi:hypothetical protein